MYFQLITETTASRLSVQLLSEVTSSYGAPKGKMRHGRQLQNWLVWGIGGAGFPEPHASFQWVHWRKPISY